MKQPVLAALVILGLAATTGLALAQDTVPAISILSPDPGITVASDTVDVVVAYQAPKGALIKRVDLLIDGTVAQSIPLDPPTRTGVVGLAWDAASYQDGEHQVVVRTVDTKEKTAKLGFAVLLRRGLPDADVLPRITSPRSGATVAGITSVEVAFAAAQAKYVIFLVDNVFKAMSNVRPFAYNWDTTGYLDGLHQLQAKAYLADGTEALSRIVEVRVDNPSGMTAARPSAPPASKPEVPPLRTPESSLPAAIYTESPTLYSRTMEVTEAEFGPPGTAPYVSASGDLVQPPAMPLAVHTEAAGLLEVATFPAAAAQGSTAPQTALTLVVAPPPAGEPTLAPAAASTTAPARLGAARAATSTPTVAPVALVLPPMASPAPATAEGEREVVAAPESLGEPAAIVAKAPAAVPAAPRAVPTEATASAVAPVVPIPLPKPSPARTPSMSILAQVHVPQPPEEVRAVPSLPSASPTQIAMLPPRQAEARVEPKLVAQPTGTATTYTVQTGDSLWSIAARHCVTVQRLVEANRLRESRAVRPGQQLRIPSTMIYVNGEPLASDAPPAVAEGRTMAPFRAVIEQTGGAVSWEPNARQAKATAQGREIDVTVGSDVATVDDTRMPMGAAAVISGGRTLVPLRFLGEVLDMALQYRDGVVHVAGRQ